MSIADINLVNDAEVRINWGNLVNLLSGSDEEKANNKGAIDQVILDLVFNWLEKRDECGVAEDLLDLALTQLAGNTLGGLAGDGYNPSGNNMTNATGSNSTDSDLSGLSLGRAADYKPSIPMHGNGGGRHLQLFAETTCSTYETTIFLGSMLSFSKCAGVEIGKVFGTLEENLVNVGLNCLNTFLQPFQRSESCASRNFQNYVMDECVKGIVRDDALGHIFQLFLVSPKKTCGCMSTLTAVPLCKVEVTESVNLDGLLASKMACLLETQICDKLEIECDHRLTVLDNCLPSLYDIDNDNFNCREVMCKCEQNDKGLLNYPGRAMELPMSDMCTEQATNANVTSFIPERYALLQEKCGAKFVFETDSPTLAPTGSPAPSSQFSPLPTAAENSASSFIREREASDSPINSVVSGMLLALSISAVALIFLVFVLALWRRRCRSAGKKVHTIAEMKLQAIEKIRKLEADIRRMEELQGADIEQPGTETEDNLEGDKKARE